MKYEIVRDDNPQNPRTEYENVGTILCTSTRYLLGEVFGWVAKDDRGETIDSCFGYYDEKDAEEDAKRSLACHQAEQAEKNEHTVVLGG